MLILCEISIEIEKLRDGLVHLRTIIEEMEKIQITKIAKTGKILKELEMKK